MPPPRRTAWTRSQRVRLRGAHTAQDFTETARSPAVGKLESTGYCHTPLRCGPEPRAKSVMDVPDESSTIGRSIPLLPQHLLTLQGPSKHFPLTFSDTCPTFAPHRSSSGNSMPAENRETNVNIGAAWWWEACKAYCAVFSDLPCLCAVEFVGSRYCAVLAYVVSVCWLRVV